MGHVSLRVLAQQLKLSTATISLALKNDARLRPDTIRRVQKAASDAGYEVDPIVSEGLTRARRRSFFRETLAWCSDTPREKQPWCEPLFRATEERGRLHGYKIEFFHFHDQRPKTLHRLCDIWKARGIRGVLIGPCEDVLVNPPFKWESFVWIAVGRSLNRPLLHRVGRDYDTDIERGLEWIKQKGCSRPGFLSQPHIRYIFHQPMLRAFLAYYQGAKHPFRESYIELIASDRKRFDDWLKKNRPDCLICSFPAPFPLPEQARELPTVILSPYNRFHPSKCQLSLSADYETIGQVSINFMHHLLTSREVGIPRLEQTVLTASPWEET